MSCKKKQTVRKRLVGTNPEGDRTFALIMQRFDTVDKDNTDIKKHITEHIDADAKVHKIVEQHKTYWSIAIKSLLGLIAGAFAVFVAWFKF